MAVLLGCDFFPTGIPGIGKELIHQLFAAWPKYWSSIDAFKIWSKRGFPFDDKKSKKGCGYKCDQCLFNQNEDLKNGIIIETDSIEFLYSNREFFV